MALSAKEKTFKTLADNGWVLDPSETVRKLIQRSNYATRTEATYADVQDPNAFVKNAAHGGTWHIRLDYSSSSYSYSRRNAVLKAVQVTYKNELGPVDIQLGDGYRNRGIRLANTDKSRWDGTSYLWEALKWKSNGDVRSLRDAADLFFKNPDLAIWLAIEETHKANIKHWLQAKDRWETSVAKARPLPVTIDMPSQFGDGNEYYRKGGWHDLTTTLKSVAYKIENADGRSDLPQLVADAHVALNNIVSVLTPEARNAMFDTLAVAYAAMAEEKELADA